MKKQIGKKYMPTQHLILNINDGIIERSELGFPFFRIKISILEKGIIWKFVALTIIPR